MSDEVVRLRIQWRNAAKEQLRAIDRTTALTILHCIDRYAKTRAGDVKRLVRPMTGCGDYRVFFYFVNDQVIEITEILNRREAYR